MKKFTHKTVLLACLAMFGLMFNSCSAKPENDDTPEETNLKIISDFTNDYGSSDAGCYEILTMVDHDSIVFHDLQSKQRDFLSSELNPDSYDENAPSYIKEHSSEMIIAKTDNYLYIFGEGRPAENDDKLDIPSYIEQRKPTGEVINHIQLPANVGFGAGKIAEGNDKIYFSAIQYDFANSDSKTSYTYRLYVYDEKTGDLSQIYVFDELTYAGIISAYDNMIIIQSFDKTDDKTLSCIHSFNVNTSEFKELCKVNLGVEAIAENLYYLSDNTVIEYNTKDNTEREIISFDSDIPSIQLVTYCFDDKIFVDTISDGNERTNYVLDAATSELKELKLRDDMGFPFNLYGRRGDYYLVITGQKDVTYTNIAPDHVTPFTDTRVDYEYAWIKKSDYCNSIPNFEPIESKIEYR